MHFTTAGFQSTVLFWWNVVSNLCKDDWEHFMFNNLLKLGLHNLFLDAKPELQRRLRCESRCLLLFRQYWYANEINSRHPWRAVCTGSHL